jgi:C4-dicarboxylate-specific signal transduction histidine kinase
MADETQLGVAVGALLTNAIEAVGSHGQVSVHVRASCIDDEQFAEILMRDDGPGISEHVRQHMFDPFFSGREAGRGLGFGLSKCWRIVTEHGGRVVVNRPADGGAEIAILLPVST